MADSNVSNGDATVEEKDTDGMLFQAQANRSTSDAYALAQLDDEKHKYDVSYAARTIDDLIEQALK